MLKLPWPDFWITSFMETEPDTKWNDIILRRQLSAHLPKASGTDRSGTSPFLGTNTAAGITFPLWGLETSADFLLGKSLHWVDRPGTACLLGSAQQMGKQTKIPLVTSQAIAPWKAWMDCFPPFAPPSPVEETLHFTMLTADAKASPQYLRVQYLPVERFHWRKANTCLLRASDWCNSKCIKPFRKADNKLLSPYTDTDHMGS